MKNGGKNECDVYHFGHTGIPWLTVGVYKKTIHFYDPGTRFYIGWDMVVPCRVKHPELV